jgi:putative ABC transport system ATP-binding protein
METAKQTIRIENFERRTSVKEKMNESATIIRLNGISKNYFIGHPNEFKALDDVNIDISAGAFVSIIGESGSGKSTLMNIIGALDRPTEGEYYLDGLNVGDEKDYELSKVRNKKIGFVFQTFNLIPRISALRNVELPMTYARIPRRERTRKAKELLKMVGMTDRMGHQPNELSGGQKQRVAIARAMANDPAIILADEPTGALDSKTGHLVMDIFHQLHEEGKTIVLITHSKDLADETERVVTLRDGSVISDAAGENKRRRSA